MIEEHCKASFVFVQGLSELALDLGIDHTIQFLGISRKAGLFINNLPFTEIEAFCREVDNRDSVCIDINYDEVIQLAELTANFTFGQYEKLKQSTAGWINSMPIGEFNFRKSLVDKFFVYITNEMYVAEINPEQVSTAQIPSKLFIILQDLPSTRISLFLRLLIQRNTIRLVTNREEINRIIANFRPRVEGRKRILSLVKAGASLSFIEKYAQEKYVDRKYFYQCRRCYQNTWQPEEINSTIIFSAFEQLMQEKRDILDVYMTLHKKLGLRIETLWDSIQETLLHKYEHDDYFLQQEVGHLINKT
ncbi:hypothetical protein [Thalassotalea sp. PP2-459]|uniref:hypothetical protein n=1 Tax=Thalassotalea sp. PP2-459 TaxID=1742724 RepID=UPI0009429702|nr:hypothetical protein [Thalassotalea sp. PP2-459]OKY27136.1 hypothetical protein BI291_18065 [Thalassotalea sp. PP2-459]